MLSDLAHNHSKKMPTVLWILFAQISQLKFHLWLITVDIYTLTFFFPLFRSSVSAHSCKMNIYHAAAEFCSLDSRALSVLFVIYLLFEYFAKTRMWLVMDD